MIRLFLDSPALWAVSFIMALSSCLVRSVPVDSPVGVGEGDVAGEGDHSSGRGISEVTCESGERIGYDLWCNQEEDCADGTDEASCGGCVLSSFQCVSDGECLAFSWVCDRATGS